MPKRLPKKATSVERLNRDLAKKVASSDGTFNKIPEAITEPILALEKFDKQVRVLATESQIHECNYFLLDLRKQTGVTTLNWSQVNRALWLLLLDKVSLDIPRESLILRKPKTNDLEAMHNFDRELARYLYYLIFDRIESKESKTTI